MESVPAKNRIVPTFAKTRDIKQPVIPSGKYTKKRIFKAPVKKVKITPPAANIFDFPIPQIGRAHV